MLELKNHVVPNDIVFACSRGGTLLTVTGRYLDSVAEPKLTITGVARSRINEAAPNTVEFETSVRIIADNFG